MLSMCNRKKCERGIWKKRNKMYFILAFFLPPHFISTPMSLPSNSGVYSYDWWPTKKNRKSAWCSHHLYAKIFFQKRESTSCLFDSAGEFSQITSAFSVRHVLFITQNIGKNCKHYLFIASTRSVLWIIRNIGNMLWFKM